ncbi:MAG: hypothetical protein O7G30_01995, partial [Proteobacteria bacterium]|nr:hypothetical protein [Pseudomonadota bacterium]
NVMLMGDTNDDGTDTVTLYERATGTFYIKNTNSAGNADTTVQFGPVPGGEVIPYLADVTGNGATIGYYTPSEGRYRGRNTNTPGSAQYNVRYGPKGANITPFMADVDGDGLDEPAFHDRTVGRFCARNTLSGGGSDLIVRYGPANDPDIIPFLASAEGCTPDP